MMILSTLLKIIIIALIKILILIKDNNNEITILLM